MHNNAQQLTSVRTQCDNATVLRCANKRTQTRACQQTLSNNVATVTTEMKQSRATKSKESSWQRVKTLRSALVLQFCRLL